MIKVDRSIVDVPKSLSSPTGAGKREQERARAHYKRQSNKSFPFSSYKEDDVVNALETLFHKKCAYCEHKYGPGCKVDVEHFRPKGAVKGDPDHPGYWWLASEWTNLLPSCVDCNRARYHEVKDGGLEHQDNSVELAALYGKGNSFPIEGLARAQRAIDDHDAELPLLIDPTKVDPADHIKWKILEQTSFATATWAGGAEDSRGRESIRVYGLNRQSLREDRYEVMLDLKVTARDLKEQVAEAAELRGAQLERALTRVMEHLVQMRVHGQSHRRYSAAVNAYIDEVIEELEADLAAAMALL